MTCVCVCVCVQGLETEKEAEAFLERLRESLSSVEGVLHRTTVPNLKALAKMREVKDMLQGVTDGTVSTLMNVLYVKHLYKIRLNAIRLKLQRDS